MGDAEETGLVAHVGEDVVADRVGKRWVDKHWKLILPCLLAAAGIAAFLLLTKIGHEVAGASVGVISVASSGYLAYAASRQLKDGPRPVELEPGGIVAVCAVREDLRWALWLEDRLNAEGFGARIQQLPIGEDAAAIEGWAVQLREEAACILMVVTARFVQAGPPASRRLEAVAADPSGRQRLVLVSTVADRPTPDSGEAIRLADVVGIRQEEEAWAVIEDDVRACGARPSARRAAAFGVRTVAFPGKGVARANLPAPNPNFIGRAKELDYLRALLVKPEGPVTERSVAVHAMSGMGKTQLAMEFVNSPHDFETVWWIRAHQTSAVYEDLTSLALKLGLPQVPDQSELLRRLWDTLRDATSWLLVYDNAESEEKLRDLVPPGGNGSVLITSQSPNWSTLLRHRFELERMSERDSVELLRRRIPVRNDQVLAQIAEQLGWLPLALEQAASYMREVQCTPAHYLKQLSKRFSETLEFGTQAYYDKSASTTYRMARELTAAQEPLSGQLMELCGFFSPDAIPRDLFEDPGQAHALPPQLADAMDAGIPYDAAISAARKFSLLTVTATTFTMHRVVQKLIRDSLTRPVRRERATSALRLLSSVFPADPDDARVWGKCGALQSHCETALAEVAQHDLVSEDSIRLSRLVGGYLRARGAYEPALKRLTAAATQLRSHPDERELALVQLGLARIYFGVADLRKAKEHGERGLALHDEVFGHDDPRTADCLLELSQIRMELSEFDAALDDARQSLLIHIRRSSGGPAAANVGLSLMTLGTAEWRLGTWLQARAHLEESVELLSTAFGPENGITARARKRLGLVLRDAAFGDRDRLVLAEREFRQAHRLLVNAYGADHPDTVAAAIHLADTRHRAALARWRLTDDHARLKRDCTAIAAEFTEIMARPPMHEKGPGRACGLVRFGHLLNHLGDHVHARELVQEARGIYLQNYGADHPYVAEALTRLIGIEYDLDDAMEADRAANEARRIYLNSYGEAHPYVRQIDAFLADPANGGRD